MFEKVKEKLKNGAKCFKETMGGYRPFDDSRTFSRILNQYQDTIDEEVDGLIEDVKNITSSTWPDEHKNMAIDTQRMLRKEGYRFYLEDAYVTGEIDATIDSILWSTIVISLCLSIPKLITKKLKK